MSGSLRANEQEQLALLRDLAARATPLLGADAEIDPITGRAILCLTLPRRRIMMAGVQDLAAAQVLEESGATLHGAGRYGGCWWLEIRGQHRLVILAARLGLTEDRGEAPQGLDPDPTHKFYATRVVSRVM